MTAAAEKTTGQDTGDTADTPVPEGHVRLSIDGEVVDAPKDELIIRTAERLGIQIPRFCDHPLLDPVAACRQCLVEVEMGGRPMPKPQPACAIVVGDGMVVKTQHTSKVADKAQQGTMELLLINHPLDCPICDKGGECPLQNQAMTNGRGDSRFVDHKRTFPKPIPISEQVLLDRERCVLCARCTRFSREIAGDPFIEMLERGTIQQVGIAQEAPFQSYFSGNTIQICPVGALTSAAYRFRSRPFDLVSEPSICEHCASGCAQRSDFRRGKVMRKLAGNDPEVNEEWDCDKGRFAFRYATSADRFTKPMLRETKNHTLRESSWTKALRKAAEGLTAARDANGVGVLTGGRLTIEDAYAYAKFARIALGTNDIDFRARPHSAEELDFLTTRILDTSPNSSPNKGVTYSALEKAPAVLCVAFEPEEESPIVFLRLRKAARKNNTKVIHIGQWKTPAVEKTFGTLLSCPPGSEAAAVDGLAKHAPDIVDSLREPGAVICVGERAAEVPGLFEAVRRLSDFTGAAVAWIPRRAGERGALYAGAAPSLLPGGRRVTDSAARAQLERMWRLTEGSLPATGGRDTNAILSAVAAGELSGLVIGGVDPNDLPDPALAEKALRQADFVLSLELRPSAATEWANVVLPVAPVVEKSGSYLNWEGRHRSFNVAVEGTGALPDCRVLDTLAIEMDYDLFTQTPAASAGELARLGLVKGSNTAATLPRDGRDSTERAKPGPDEALLATWTRLLDNGSLQAEEPHLAGTARAAVAKISVATARRLGVELPGPISVGTDRGWISIDAEAADLPDNVVWLPTNSGPSKVRKLLAAGHGSVVRLASGTAPAATAPAGAATARTARTANTRKNEDGAR